MKDTAERIRRLLNEIMQAGDFGHGESGTEALLGALEVAVRVAKKEARASHRHGLFIDCTTVLAYELAPDDETVMIERPTRKKLRLV